MKREWTVAAGIAGVFLAVLVLVAVLNGCDDGRDLLGPRPAAQTSSPGCGPPDAGPEAGLCGNEWGLVGCP